MAFQSNGNSLNANFLALWETGQGCGKRVGLDGLLSGASD
jgi:hypothetical protein